MCSTVIFCTFVHHCMHSLVLNIPTIIFGLILVSTFILCCFGIFTQIQDSQHSTAPSFPQVIVGDAGVEAGITGFAIPNPEASVLLVLHVEEVVVVVPVQGGLRVPSHRYLETDVAACPHGGVPHFAYENGWSWGGMTRSLRLWDDLLRARLGPLRGDDGARGCHCLVCPFLQGHLHLGFSHG